MMLGSSVTFARVKMKSLWSLFGGAATTTILMFVLVPLFRSAIDADYARPAWLLGPLTFFLAAFIGAYITVISAPSPRRYDASVVLIPVLLISVALWREVRDWSAFVPLSVAALAVPFGAATARASMPIRLRVQRLHFRQWPGHYLFALCAVWTSICFMSLPSLYGAQVLMADLRTGGMLDRFIVRLPDDRTILWSTLVVPQFILVIAWLVVRHHAEHVRNRNGAA
jgi:hypothetical protein